MEVKFVDTSGNCFLNSKVGYILVCGQKHPAVKKTSVFSQAGRNIVFALLTQPQQHTYRDIATASDVLLGKFSTAVKTLLEQAYLFRSATREIQIADREQLIKLGYIKMFNE